jgi:hypothetical protein
MTNNLLYYSCYNAIQYKSNIINCWPFVHLLVHHTTIETYGTAGMATYDIAEHTHCILDTYTLRICNAYCFSAATTVTRMRVNARLYLHRLCYVLIFITIWFTLFYIILLLISLKNISSQVMRNGVLMTYLLLLAVRHIYKDVSRFLILWFIAVCVDSSIPFITVCKPPFYTSLFHGVHRVMILRVYSKQEGACHRSPWNVTSTSMAYRTQATLRHRQYAQIKEEKHITDIQEEGPIICQFLSVHAQREGRDSSASIATRYGMDGTGNESRWRRDFSHPSRPALGPTQPPIQWVPGLSRGLSRRGVVLTIHSHLAPRLKKE